MSEYSIIDEQSDETSYGKVYAWGEITNWVDSDDTLSFTWNVHVCGTSGGSWDGPYQFGFNLAASYDYNGVTYHTDGTDSYYNGDDWSNDSVDIEIPKNGSEQIVTLYLNMESKTVNDYGGAPSTIMWNSQWGTVTVSPKKYYPHGEPTINADKTTVHYDESIQLSWAKSKTQGNANFNRFELLCGDKELYSGSNTSFTVIPSDATGATGGTVTYTLKEIHDWYGSYFEKSATTTIDVKSGVVTVYDSSGNKHTGLVTVYDSSGKAHYVLITAYDSSGNAHNVV